MNASELALKMLEWERVKLQLDALEAEIKSAVLEIGKTQNVGNVKASYTAGRREFDFETPARESPLVGETTVALFTTHTPEQVIPASDTVDWRGICKHAGVEPLVTKEPPPSVKVTLAK